MASDTHSACAPIMLLAIEIKADGKARRSTPGHAHVTDGALIGPGFVQRISRRLGDVTRGTSGVFGDESPGDGPIKR